MKHCIMIWLALTAFAARAQSPAPDPDTLKNPVKTIDPEVKQLPADAHYVTEAVRINADDLPAAVLQHLKKLEPSAWRKSVVYHYKKDKYYLVEIRAAEREKTYRFSEDGKLQEAAKDAGD